MENPLDDRYKQAGEMPGYEDCPQTYRVTPFPIRGVGFWGLFRRWCQSWFLFLANARLYDPARRCWQSSESTEGRPCALKLNHPGPHGAEPLTRSGRSLEEILGELTDRHRELMNERQWVSARVLSDDVEALAVDLGWRGIGREWAEG